MENVRPWLLASASPRRAKILASLGIPYVVRATDAVETVCPDPADTVKANALAKYRVAAAATDAVSFARILAADTIVALDGGIIGKPRDRADAIAMLLTLSGREQTVFTGVAIGVPGAEPDVFVDTSTVRFNVLTPDEAATYVDEAHTLDRAGAYDIDTKPELIIASYAGSRTNIMGLPAERIAPYA